MAVLRRNSSPHQLASVGHHNNINTCHSVRVSECHTVPMDTVKVVTYDRCWLLLMDNKECPLHPPYLCLDQSLDTPHHHHNMTALTLPHFMDWEDPGPRLQYHCYIAFLQGTRSSNPTNKYFY